MSQHATAVLDEFHEGLDRVHSELLLRQAQHPQSALVLYLVEQFIHLTLRYFRTSQHQLLQVTNHYLGEGLLTMEAMSGMDILSNVFCKQ